MSLKMLLNKNALLLFVLLRHKNQRELTMRTMFHCDTSLVYVTQTLTTAVLLQRRYYLVTKSGSGTLKNLRNESFSQLMSPWVRKHILTFQLSQHSLFTQAVTFWFNLHAAVFYLLFHHKKKNGKQTNVFRLLWSCTWPKSMSSFKEGNTATHLYY